MCVRIQHATFGDEIVRDKKQSCFYFFSFTQQVPLCTPDAENNTDPLQECFTQKGKPRSDMQTGENSLYSTTLKINSISIHNWE